ncbi:2-octaprenyl-6-methoxyphenol hydroxylase [Tistlia consotensis]|uniref:2-octaprenyl-6-methoxyphenol hydroxylase n=1 Tax=Tistlia consotensis USBA 355 TaxID=560819 RepID=A0A1Y6BIM1_9PROT|nr:UbiH/UbiF/VisC/COQ6 family ubiquinone biosynthesis hydroxylase [Tistlia consotensis]SMF09508.1 2-octaprenyl-6-methoxyphenol hydroxylase [Tistlia consotensis USBA 355]SNR34476.1 2-octaprenyl-6-methoxyphenol hydroxylase [Tistlia consotensis]
MVSDNLTVEVAIAGGGLAGLTLGCALAGAGLEVAVVDAEAPATALDEPFDGRASAIALGSQRLLRGIGVWRHVGADAAPIHDIRVSDGRVGEAASRLFLHYDVEEVAGELGPEPGGPAMGWIVENRVTRRALHRRAAELPTLRHLAPARVEGAERGESRAVMTLADGRRVTAPLVVACDGRNSPLRQAAGIPMTRWDYPQDGIVATLIHALDHEGVAHEHFLPSGPFAVLPLTDLPDGRHRSSLVWTERREVADGVMRLDDAAFSREIERRFGDSLGRIEVAGRRWRYPLGLQLAQRTIDRRLALVGDAAHVIHPIAGQGFNLGLRDIGALAEVLVDARRLGLDLGSAPVLERYQRWRRFDNLALVAVTDGLNRLFSNDLGSLRLARDLGLAAVNRAAPLKRLFMRHAMGLVGELPRLCRGEPL